MDSEQEAIVDVDYDIDRPLSAITEWLTLAVIKDKVQVLYYVTSHPGLMIMRGCPGEQELAKIAAEAVVLVGEACLEEGEELPDVWEVLVHRFFGLEITLRFRVISLIDQDPPTGAIN